MDKKKLTVWLPIALVVIILLAAVLAASISSSDEGDPMAPGPINTTSTPTPNVEA